MTKVEVGDKVRYEDAHQGCIPGLTKGAVYEVIRSNSLSFDVYDDNDKIRSLLNPLTENWTLIESEPVKNDMLTVNPDFIRYLAAVIKSLPAKPVDTHSMNMLGSARSDTAFWVNRIEINDSEGLAATLEWDDDGEEWEIKINPDAMEEK